MGLGPALFNTNLCYLVAGFPMSQHSKVMSNVTFGKVLENLLGDKTIISLLYLTSKTMFKNMLFFISNVVIEIIWHNDAPRDRSQFVDIKSL